MSDNPSSLKNDLPLLQLEHVSKSFAAAQNHVLKVLHDISFSLQIGEITTLLGKSGSGKSTLLRIMAGLMQPTHGTVKYQNHRVLSPSPGIAMVFQDFALMPWLTVLQNVALGLEALGVGRAERQERAHKAIEMIGLTGFDKAYPKELSGGMQQRVGFARALVVEPTILLLDEAFSALDVFIAENLRTDLINLWEKKQTPIKNIFSVTHNITEAVLMSDRVIVLNSDPGSIRTQLSITLPRPRNEEDPAVRALIKDIHTLMTT